MIRASFSVDDSLKFMVFLLLIINHGLLFLDCPAQIHVPQVELKFSP
jgi:hypothetical protein